jgi:hypothetical protein
VFVAGLRSKNNYKSNRSSFDFLRCASVAQEDKAWGGFLVSHPSAKLPRMDGAPLFVAGLRLKKQLQEQPGPFDSLRW